MALPLGLCTDSKRSLNFCLFKKNHNPSTMLDKGGISVYSTSSGYTPNIVDQKETKHHSFIHQSGSFDSKSKVPDVWLVGGFLGSKSQVRSNNSQPRFCDLIGEIIHCSVKFVDYKFRSVSTSPEKNTAEPVSLSKVIGSFKFPFVIDEQPSPDNSVEGPKQSYAEVAKLATCKPGRPKVSSQSHDIKESGSRRGTRNRRRTHSAEQKSSKRRLNRRDKRENILLQASGSEDLPSPMSTPQPDWKDLRLNQQEKHFGQVRAGSNVRNPKKKDRFSNFQPSLDRRDQLKIERGSEGQSCPKRRAHYRSHCDNKRGTRARNFNCDIDKINWRTGEPIFGNMGSQCIGEMHMPGDAGDESFNDSFSSEVNSADCSGEQRSHEFCPSDVTSWPDKETVPSRCRQRSFSSECSVDSEDSENFIVFQSGAPSEESQSDFESDYSDFDSDDTYDSDSAPSDEDDSCDALSPLNHRLQEVNDLWRREYPMRAGSPHDDSSEVQASNSKHRKVCFSNSKPLVHNMLAWDFAYRSARPGPWEEMARDRERFKTRIRQFEGILSPVLAADHRNKIWQKINKNCERSCFVTRFLK